MYVSVSAFNDGDLLDGCLAAVREVLPAATVAVVDGRYETWPDGETGGDNSTDETAAIASAHDATYHAAGPFPRECDKHEHRVTLAPEGEFCLLLDADERLHEFDQDALDADLAYQPRIFNAAVYGPRAVWWPRLFRPEWVQDINRWDAYLFDVDCIKTDAVTIVHRHDLRGREYRENKVERFHNEGRASRYEHTDPEHDRLDQYIRDEWDLATTACPNCGAESVTRSQVTGYGDEYSVVEACIATDGCYRRTKQYQLDGWEYLPDEWPRGFREDVERLRVELHDAGCSFVGPLTPSEMQQMRPAIGNWVDHNLTDSESEQGAI